MNFPTEPAANVRFRMTERDWIGNYDRRREEAGGVYALISRVILLLLLLQTVLYMLDSSKCHYAPRMIYIVIVGAFSISPAATAALDVKSRSAFSIFFLYSYLYIYLIIGIHACTHSESFRGIHDFN